MTLVFAIVLIAVAALPGLYKNALTFNKGSFIGGSITVAPLVQLAALVGGEVLLFQWASASPSGLVVSLVVNAIGLAVCGLSQTRLR